MRRAMAARMVPRPQREVAGAEHPVHETLIGGVEALDDTGRTRWLVKLERLGEAAA